MKTISGMYMLRNIISTLDLDRAGGALLANLLLRRREAAVGSRAAVTEAEREKREMWSVPMPQAIERREEDIRDVAVGVLLLVSLADGLLESLGGLLLATLRDGAGGVVEADVELGSATEEAAGLERGLIEETTANEVVDGSGVDVVELDSGGIAGLKGDGAGSSNGCGGEGNDDGGELHDEDNVNVKLCKSASATIQTGWKEGELRLTKELVKQRRMSKKARGEVVNTAGESKLTTPSSLYSPVDRGHHMPRTSSTLQKFSQTMVEACACDGIWSATVPRCRVDSCATVAPIPINADYTASSLILQENRTCRAEIDRAPSCISEGGVSGQVCG